MAAFLLPLATAQTRWPVEERVSTTDATPTHGGATRISVSSELAVALYRTSEQKGCRTRLSGMPLDTTGLLPAFP